MRIVVLVLLVLINQSLAGGGGGKHRVHLRIHVPDIIKHHIHTKTVFIHVHHGGHGGGGKKTVPKKKHVPKKKETHHEEGHHEDWSSWSSYDVHSGHGDGHDHGHGHGHGHEHHGTKGAKPSGKDHMHGKMPKPHGHSGHYALGGYGQGYGHGHDHDPRSHAYGNAHSQMLVNDPGYDHPVPPQQDPSGPSGYGGSGPGGAVGYSYPPQYGTHENIKHVTETPNEVFEPYNEAYEEGYRKGHLSHTGHILSEDMKNFYDNNFEEGDAENNAYNDHAFENYKNHEDLENNDAAAADHDGYNYHDGEGYHSTATDSR